MEEKMNKLRTNFILSTLALVLVSASLVNAQASKGTPPSPQRIAEIRETRGAALLTYYPEYARYVIPVAGAVSTVRHPNAPTAKRIEEIRQTRGAALLRGWDR
jgi:hypothetical protein